MASADIVSKGNSRGDNSAYEVENVCFFQVPDIGDTEIVSILETMTSGWPTSGPKLQFRRYSRTTSGETIGRCEFVHRRIHLALEAAGVGPGDDVLVPTMNFGATGGVVVHVGAKPVPVDSRPGDLNIDVSAAEQLITQKMKAIIPVHYACHAFAK